MRGRLDPAPYGNGQFALIANRARHAPKRGPTAWASDDAPIGGGRTKQAAEVVCQARFWPIFPSGPKDSKKMRATRLGALPGAFRRRIDRCF